MNEQQRVAASRVVLRGVAGSNFGRSFTLSESRVIGRAASADIRLDGAGIAERHAVGELHGERLVLRALAPGATTTVNGLPMRDALLAPGDQLMIEQHRFMVEAPGLPPRGQNPSVKLQGSAHTQTLQKVRSPAASAATAAPEPALQPGRDPASLWWLIAAAAVLAAAVTALVVYAPRLA